MPFECKKYHGRCKAGCCGPVPIKRTLWQKKQHAIQRPIKELMIGTSKEGKIVIPLTKDHYCAFLKEDLSCAIYEDRPDICRKFGDESHKLSCCPMQKVDGSPRNTDEMNELEEEMLKPFEWGNFKS